jgi:Right handed beta helix region
LRFRAALILGFAGIALCAQTATASATQYFVDGGSGADSNTCLQATAGAPPLGPCETIGQALALAQANAGADEVLVADGTYAETLAVDDATDLRALEATDPKPVIDNTPTAAPAITVTSAGSAVQGLSVTSGFTAVSVQAGATVTGNVFSFPVLPSGPGNADLNITAGAGSPTISGNTFHDDVIPSDEQAAIRSASTGSPTISGNSLDGFFQGIAAFSAGGATPVISGNVITGTHNTASLGTGIRISQGASATLTQNDLHDPGAGTPQAIAIFQNSPAPNAAAALTRNRVIGHQIGLSVIGTLGLVTLDSDLIAGANGAGIQMFENSGNGGGDVSATNVTVIDTAGSPDISLGAGADLTLDSSIVGAGNVTPGINDQGTGTCAITFSRGDGNNGCTSGFVTTADPMFAGAGDYHLLAGSPMIDAGNPLSPGAGVLDIDGDPRALDATPACAGNVDRRDIGADEFVLVPVSGCPAPPGAAVPTAPATPKRKCKRHKKHRQAGAAKKCKKKRR